MITSQAEQDWRMRAEAAENLVKCLCAAVNRAGIRMDQLADRAEGEDLEIISETYGKAATVLAEEYARCIEEHAPQP